MMKWCTVRKTQCSNSNEILNYMHHEWNEKTPLQTPSLRTNFKQPCQQENNENTSTRQQQLNIKVAIQQQRDNDNTTTRQ